MAGTSIFKAIAKKRFWLSAGHGRPVKAAGQLLGPARYDLHSTLADAAEHLTPLHWP